MSTLLMALVGPMQAWGIDAKFNHRSTQGWPSKSAVVGLVAAALGLDRGADISHLAALRFGVRIDAPGKLMTDFQTEVVPAKGKSQPKPLPLTYRDYLVDAKFVAALEGDRELLERIDSALRNPVFPLFLGRRSCPPSERIARGIVDVDLQEALRTAEPLVELNEPLNLSIEREPLAGEVPERFLPDQPITFDVAHRKFVTRPVVHEIVQFNAGGESDIAYGMEDLDPLAFAEGFN